MTPSDERNAPYDPLIVAHGARSLVLTVAVHAIGIVAIAKAWHVDPPLAWLALAWPAAPALSFLIVRTSRSGAGIPLGTLGDSRLVFAIVGAAILVMMPDGIVDEPASFNPAGMSDPTTMHATMHAMAVSALTEAIAIGLAPVAIVLLLLASLMCGLADGAWTATAMRHMKLTFVQALRVHLRAIRSGEDTLWRIVTGGRP